MTPTTRRVAWLASACLGLGACGSPAPAPRSPVSHPRELAAAIDELAADEVRRTPAAGLAVAVVWHGETVVAKGYGLADVEHGTPVTADTVFRIGSITKQFTAAAILSLAAAHQLALDDDLTRYLPDYPSHGKRITLRNLLTHTSGIRDYEHGLPWFHDHMAEQRPGAELVAQFAAAPLDFEPGTRWSYSNSGYYLLGLIIERVSGQPYADYVRDHVIAASGATGIRYCPDEQDYPNAARGYELGDRARTAARPIKMVYAYAAGALCATAPGVVAWSRALSHGRVVDAAAWRAMTAPVTLGDGSQFGYGLGLFVSELGGHRALVHGGGINGFVATLAYYPDDELYVAVLVDTEGGFADELGEAIARRVLAIPRPAERDLAVSASEAAELVGRYQLAAMGQTLIVEAQDGKLYARRDGGTARPRLVSQGDRRFLLRELGATLVFEPSAGRATTIRVTQSGATFEGQRVP